MKYPRYKIGDRVCIPKEGYYYSQSKGNPGTIYDFSEGYESIPDENLKPEKFYFKIKWDSGNENTYRLTDIVPFDYKLTIGSYLVVSDTSYSLKKMFVRTTSEFRLESDGNLRGMGDLITFDKVLEKNSRCSILFNPKRSYSPMTPDQIKWFDACQLEGEVFDESSKYFKYKVGEYVEVVESCSTHKKGEVFKIVKIDTTDRVKIMSQKLLNIYPDLRGWITERNIKKLDVEGRFIKINKNETDEARVQVGDVLQIGNLSGQSIKTTCNWSFGLSSIERGDLTLLSKEYSGKIIRMGKEQDVVKSSSEPLVEKKSTDDDTAIKKGDFVYVVKTQFADEEWKRIGKIHFPYKIGTKVKVTDLGTGYCIEDRGWFPRSGFSKTCPPSSFSEESEIKIGDSVYVVKTEFSEDEWKGIGNIHVPFFVGELVTVETIATGYYVSGYGYFPRCGFSKYPPTGSAIVESSQGLNGVGYIGGIDPFDFDEKEEEEYDDDDDDDDCDGRFGDEIEEDDDEDEEDEIDDFHSSSIVSRVNPDDKKDPFMDVESIDITLKRPKSDGKIKL